MSSRHTPDGLFIDVDLDKFKEHRVGTLARPSPAFVPTHTHNVPDDHERAAWLREHPHDVVEMDDDTCAFCGLPVVAIDATVPRARTTARPPCST